MKKWKDCGTYWLSTFSQGDKEWYKLRKRVTASKFGACVGHNLKYDTIEDTALEMANLKKRIITPEEKAKMDRGISREPIAREWYNQTRKVKVEEVGIAIPKWDPRLGASPDGLVGRDGMIEIKSPDKMYSPLQEYIFATELGWTPDDIYYHNHITHTYYDQMQGTMAIFDRKWCDYIVFCPLEDTIYTERILFNKLYWEEELYPKLCSFITNNLEPLMGPITIPNFNE